MKKEHQITEQQLQTIMDDEWNDFVSMIIPNCFCQGCSDTTTIVDYTIWVNDLYDVILRGKCKKCGEMVVRCVETGEDEEKVGRMKEMKKKRGETFAVSDKCIIETRSNNQFLFWYLTEDSLQSAEEKLHYTEAYLMNAGVMAIATLESLLNNIGEFYLPQSVWKVMDSSKEDTKARYKDIIKALAGNKHDDNFFSKESWCKICDLILLRHEVMHNKTQSFVKEVTDECGKTMQEDIVVDVNSIPSLVSHLKDFLGELRDYLRDKVYEGIEERYMDFFSFLEKN